MHPRTKRYFFTLSILTFILLGTWFFPLTQPVWDFLDTVVYKGLHYNLLKSDFSQKFWAVMNSRIVDNVSHVCILLVLTRYIFMASCSLRRSVRVRQVLFIIVTTVVSVIISKSAQSQIASRVSIKRDSPSIVHGHYVALSKVMPGLKNVKDSSRRSFPGDHAMTLILFALYGLYFMKNPWLKYSPIGIAIFFSLPRIVSGGHWLTDTLMGSLPIASFFFIIWIGLVNRLNLIAEPERNLELK